MANPQKENGYTAIANELFEAVIAFRIPGEVRQVFDAILRKTYGYNKKEDYIANSQLVELTGMKKQNVSRALARLLEHKLVIKTDYSSRKGNMLKINKDYHQWISFVIKADDKKASSKKIKKSSKKITRVIKSDDKVSSEVMDTKDKTISKVDIQKTHESSAELSEVEVVKGEIVEDDDFKIKTGERWNELIDAFEPVNPMYRNFYKRKTERVALQDVVKAIGFKKTIWLIKHLKQATSKPYAPRITKPTHLCEKLGDLQTFWEQEKAKKQITSNTGRGLA